MPSSPRVILLEFNELTPRLMDRFIAEGKLPHFKRFQRESTMFTTEAAEVAPHLEPWIQWVTVHTGLNYSDHGLYHLNEGHKLTVKRIWDLISEAGFPAVVCGSMNVRYEPGFKGVAIPDPWCTEVPPTPDELSLYFRFVQKNVLEYSNDRVPLSQSDYLAFAWFLSTHGLSPTTVNSILKQLISERAGSGNRWKRAVLLDKLQLDLFRWYFRKTNARFATFFLNSTAHFQHSYWRNMEPEAFKVKPGEAEQEEYGSAVAYGYQQMDDVLGQLMSFSESDTTLIFSTALSQQPCLKYESAGGAHFHRPRDFADVGRFADITGRFTSAPVMTHQFHLDFEGDTAAADAEGKLRAIKMDGVPVLQIERTGARIFTGCRVYTQTPRDTRVVVEGTDRSTAFFDLFYQMETIKSGMHHPDGMLWIRSPRREHVNMPGKVPLAAVAPTILQMFGIAKPDYMRESPLPLADGVLATQ